MRNILLLILFCLSFQLFAQRTEYQKADIDRKIQSFRKTSSSQQNALYNKYDVTFYFLNLELTNTSVNVAGKVSITAKVIASSLDTFAFELLSNLTVDSVKINGILRNINRQGDETFVLVSPSLPNGSSFTTEIWYNGNPNSGGSFFSGISHATSQTWGAQVTWTLSEPFNAYQWWPCKQVLSDKADSAWIFLTVPNTCMAGSNGVLTQVVNLTGNKKRFEWKTRYPINYYLISASVGPYIDYSIYAHLPGMNDSLRIQNFVYNNPSTLPYFKSYIDQTRDFIQLYSQLFGLYPFYNEKYGHCMAPLGGGMEHQTMTTLGYFNFYLVCHELSHQWWGDYVTCATWSDIWINEGFASYAEYLAAQYLDSYTEAQSHMLDVHQNVMSKPNGSIYIPVNETNNENRIFDSRLSYDKGSAIIHMIRFIVNNDSLFFLSLRNFLQQYAHGVATGLQFKQVVETTANVNLTNFFNQWYFGEGYPTFSGVWRKEADSLIFTISQTVSAPSVTPVFTLPLELKVARNYTDTLIRVNITSTSNSFKVKMPGNVTGMTFDPNNWIVNKAGNFVQGLSEIQPLSCTVSPNPFNDELQIQLDFNPTQNTRIEIFDISGRLILKYQPNSAFFSLLLGNLAKGAYVLSISDGSKKGQKLIVKE